MKIKNRFLKIKHLEFRDKFNPFAFIKFLHGGFMKNDG
jgi:hypothetical protein